jgi:hypothetical protein
VLVAAGNLLAASLYAQQPPMARPEAGLAVPSGKVCKSSFLPQLGYPPRTKKGALSPDSFAAFPVTSVYENSPSGCGPSGAVNLASDAFLSLANSRLEEGHFRLGYGSVGLWASPEQLPAADEKGQSTADRGGSPGHIFWVVPAYKVDYAKRFAPLSPREKFKEWAQSAYDPLGLGAGAVEGATLEHSSTDGFCGYGKGWGGYGKCFTALEVDSDVSSFIGDYALTVLWHQDPRYFRVGEGSFGRRLWYAVSRVFVTYTDSGRTTFYSSALSGTVIAAGLSNLYYPQQDRGLGHTMSRIAIDLGNTALYNASAEFWPDIKHKLYSAF